MDLLIVAKEADGAASTAQEVTDNVDARALLPPLPHGPQVAQLVSRLSIGTLELSPALDRGAARAAIGVSVQRSRPKGVILLGQEFGRELLGEGLPLAGGIREMHGRPVGALGQAKPPEIERLLSELCSRAGIPWSPPSSRAIAARTVVKAEEAVAQAATLIEREQWAQAVELLRAAEPLAPRGTNMLGRALMQLGDKDGARRAFERTLAADPGNSIAQRQLASLGAG